LRRHRLFREGLVVASTDGCHETVRWPLRRRWKLEGTGRAPTRGTRHGTTNSTSATLAVSGMMAGVRHHCSKCLVTSQHVFDFLVWVFRPVFFLLSVSFPGCDSACGAAAKTKEMEAQWIWDTRDVIRARWMPTAYQSSPTARLRSRPLTLHACSHMKLSGSVACGSDDV